MNKLDLKGTQHPQPRQTRDNREVKRRSNYDKPELSTQELREIAFRKLHIRMQKRLNKIEGRFSKIVHTSYMELLSDRLSQSIARPMGMFIGSFAAFSGSLILLILSSRYGFRYNYSAPLYLYSAGYILGCIFEIAQVLLRKYR